MARHVLRNLDAHIQQREYFRLCKRPQSGEPVAGIFQGRQVSESTGFGTKYDNCFFTGSQVPKFDKVVGSQWNVGYYGINPPFITSVNEWADDYIGWNTSQVDYYRSHSSNCGARIPQSMYITTQGLSGISQNYSNGSVGEDIYPDHVTAIRNGVSQTIYR